MFNNILLPFPYRAAGFISLLLVATACTLQPLQPPEARIAISFMAQQPSTGERDVMEALLSGSLVMSFTMRVKPTERPSLR